MSKKRVFSYELFAKPSPFGQVNIEKIYSDAEKAWKTLNENSHTYPSLFGFDISEENIDKAKLKLFFEMSFKNLKLLK